MPNYIKYGARIGPSCNRFGLAEVSPKDAILVVDNKSSDFSLKKINLSPSVSQPKVVYETRRSRGVTHILSNTADILITDIYDEYKSPLFYKSRVKPILYDHILINGEKVVVVDQDFMYSNHESGVVEYRDWDGTVLSKCELVAHPVYIWEGLIHNRDITDVDGKTFSYGLNGDKIMATVRSTKVTVRPGDGDIFELRRVGDLEFELTPLIHSVSKYVMGRRVEFTYDYSRVIPNIKTALRSACSVVGGESLKLKNRNVIKDTLSVKGYSKDGLMSDIIYDEHDLSAPILDLSVLDNSIRESEVDSSLGTVDFARVLRESGVDPFTTVFVARYEYVEYKGNSVSLGSDYSSLINKKAVMTIVPTTIVSGGGTPIQNNQDITHTLLNADGTVSSSTNLSVGEHQYVVRDWDVTGWGDGEYSSGPFGGSVLNTIEEIQRLIDIRENSALGNIIIGEIDFTPDVSRSSMIVSKVESRSLQSPIDSMYIYSGNIWHRSWSGEYADIGLPSGISEIRSMAGLSVEGARLADVNLQIFVEFDISKLSSAMNGSGYIDQAWVAPHQAVQDTMLHYQNIVPSAVLSIDNLVLYEKLANGEMSTIMDINAATVTDDMSKLIVSLPPSYESSEVGLGLLSGSTKTYPTVFIKL